MPSSYQGGPRSNVQNYQDAMTIAREFGSIPDMFITITMDPNCPVVLRCLEEGQTPDMRDDIVCKVWQAKLKAILDDILNNQVLGKTVAHVYTIEFQKRGLPHAHLIIYFRAEDKIKNIEQVNNLIWAELPSKAQNPELYRLVTKCMMHGPCGNGLPGRQCLNETGECSKQFPKDYTPETVFQPRQYPNYRRREDRENEFPRALPNGEEFSMDNRWVVPYNPFLLLKYKMHINVEACCSVQSVKYKFKYIHKGPDAIDVSTVTVTENADQSKVKIHFT
jgi:ATP-dependent DNA helicase PIF1